MYGRRVRRGYGSGYDPFLAEEVLETEILEEEVFDGGFGGPQLGFDPMNGDPVMEMPGGFGIDLANGDPTVDVGPFGFDI